MYIARRNGIIVGVYTQWHKHAQEILSKDNVEVLTFLDTSDVYKNEKKITKRIRRLAVDSLKGDGGLPPDYEDVRRQAIGL